MSPYAATLAKCDERAFITAVALALGRDHRQPERLDTRRYMTASGHAVLWQRREEAAILRAFAEMGRGEGVRCG